MDRAKRIVKRLLYPPKWVLFLLPLLSFSALIALFAVGNTDSVPAYFLYCLSAYALCILLVKVPAWAAKGKAMIQNANLVRRFTASPFGRRYLGDLAFRGEVSLYQGILVNFLYCLFRIAAFLRYRSAWFASLVVYYLFLGALRTFLIFHFHKGGREREARCYRWTGWLLFLLNIPMGGMIVLMVRTDSGFTYPGYIIYVSALYAFYAMTIAVVNLVRFRRLGSPILSAAKVLNFVYAMMSILGLQTAMISQFSQEGEAFRIRMNAITGGFVWAGVILIAVYMLVHSAKQAESRVWDEQIGK